jgi:Na+-translocating ferredoxin:NAD+ oxidoreductase RnfE subunit
MNGQPSVFFWIGLGSFLAIVLVGARREIADGSVSVWRVIGAWAGWAGTSYLFWWLGLSLW